MIWFKLIKGIFGRFNRKGYSLEQPVMTQMIQIRCGNPECKLHKSYFEIDPNPYRAIRGAEEGEDGAESFIIKCPECGARNKIFLIIREESELSILQKLGLKKQPPHNRGPNYVDVPF